MAIPRAIDAPRAGSLDDALAGRLGWRAVRDIATRPTRHGIGPLLEACGASPSSDLVLLRTKYKPGRKLTAHYRMLGGPDGRARDVAVRWHVTPAARAAASEAVQTGDVGAISADGRMSLLMAPADPSMPQLERLHRPAHLASIVASAEDRHGVAGADLEIETIRYRPGERHVLRVSAPRRSAVVFVKTDRDDSGARAVPIARAVGAALAGGSLEAGVAEPIGHVPGDNAAVWRLAPGRPLWGRLHEDARSTADLLERLGQAIRIIHDDVVAPDAAMSRDLLDDGARSADAEARATLRAGQHIVALLPEAGHAYEAMISEIAEELGRRSIEAATLIHGDLKCDNVITSGRRIRLLDFDRAGPGDAAVDLGKIMADLRWWLPAGNGRDEDLIAAFRSGYGSCDGSRWERARLLAVLFQLKLAARRCAVHDDGWAMRVPALIESAARALERERAYA